MDKTKDMQDDKTAKLATDREEWIIKVRDELAGSDQVMRARFRTTINCSKTGAGNALFVPTEMASDQPELLEYLHAFASSQDMTLIEDRRNLSLSPIVERRKRNLPKLALGISLLLKQTGLPGPTRSLSSPHVLAKGNKKMDVAEIIRTAAGVLEKSHKVIFLPNRFIRDNLDDKTATMNGYACKVVGGNESTTFTQFECDKFHAIGYITNNQFVVNVFLAGGPIARPELWTSWENLTDSPVKCQVFDSPFPGQNYGLFYQTYYIDLESSTERTTPASSQSA